MKLFPVLNCCIYFKIRDSLIGKKGCSPPNFIKARIKSCLPSFSLRSILFLKNVCLKERGSRSCELKKNCTLFCKDTFIYICDKVREKQEGEEGL